MPRLGIDTGGTFTDFVWIGEHDIEVLKVPSFPQSPEKPVIDLPK